MRASSALAQLCQEDRQALRRAESLFFQGEQNELMLNRGKESGCMSEERKEGDGWAERCGQEMH